MEQKKEPFKRRLRRFFRGSPTDWRSLPPRTILSNSTDTRFPNNSITTSKYSLLTFIPLNLYEQFSKMANIYFLVAGVLQMIPAISTSNGIPTEYSPLAVILFVTALKDIYEDMQRHKNDKAENERKYLKGNISPKFVSTFRATEVIRGYSDPKHSSVVQNINLVYDDSVRSSNSVWNEVPSRDLYVGNLVKITQNQTIPADIIILKSSLPSGQCYVETAQLDGETNLKIKSVPLSPLFSGDQDVSSLENQFKIDLEGPNPFLYKFHGSVALNNEQIPLAANNLLLRGTVLRNTNYIIGLVIYTGHETKVMLNSHKPRGKDTKLQAVMNKLILYLFAFQWALCFFCALYATIWAAVMVPRASYLFEQEEISKAGEYIEYFFVRLGNWFILFVNFVPISMMITLEMIRLFQAFFIINDKYLSWNGMRPTVQSSNLNDDLGQISHIFSDKTGTLTCNSTLIEQPQIPRCLWMNGVHFGQEHFNPKKARKSQIARNTQSINLDLDDDNCSETDFLLKSDDLQATDSIHTPKSMISPVINEEVSYVNFSDEKYFKALKDERYAEQLEQVLLCLSLCNDVLLDADDPSKLSTSSPDELALVNFARFSGFKILNKTHDGEVTLEYNNKEKVYKILNVLDFSSQRKRMSVIVEDQNKNITIYTKGADSVMIPRMIPDSQIEDLMASLVIYSMFGLRTLVLGMKEIERAEYVEWNKQYRAAENQIHERDKALEILQDRIEQSLILVGATAIEDKLQEKVPETVNLLKQANIQLWILTGDKKETALNIGYATGIVKQKDRILYLDLEDESVSRNVSNVTIDFNSEKFIQLAHRQLELTEKQTTSLVAHQINACLLITGEYLLLMNSEELKKRLIKVASVCSCVIASRVSPKQKREIVEMFKQHFPSYRTLAIGDGANDVNMITEAHVGVGIQGLEGTQAARASDFSIPQFSGLKRLLLFHGRECHRRNAQVVLYNFYKNILYLIPQFWFGFTNGFSGQTLYDLIIFQCYNFMYTSLPIIVYGVLDLQYKKVKDQTQPHAYILGLVNGISFRLFCISILEGAIQSCIIFYFTFYCLNGSFRQGRELDFIYDGQVVFLCAVIIANIKIVILQQNLPFLQVITLLMSYLSYIISMWICSIIINYMLFQIWEEMLSTIQTYAVVVLAVFTSCMFQVAFARYQYLVSRGVKSFKKPKHRELEEDNELGAQLL